MSPETKARAKDIQVGWRLRDTSLLGTHAQRIVVEWVRHHDSRGRTYLAGIGEYYQDPVHLAYDDDKEVTVWHD